ncbi:hypothetical protein RJT34_30956 [Clitoria ternatea]|uniref:Casein kinase II subunit beta n=1 Tax=Clitoria ternatea TaxID=43366 RepID=A0AAN9EUE2_CLITE
MHKERKGEVAVGHLHRKPINNQQQPSPSSNHRRSASLPNNSTAQHGNPYSSPHQPYSILQIISLSLDINFKEESETDVEGSDLSGSEGDDASWISWFCNLRGNEFFCEIDDDYVQDDFNLCGLSSQVPYYDYALDLILDVESSHGDMFTEEQNELVESAAEMLYGLIHARYILTSKGMATMTSIRTTTLADVQECTALDNPAFQLASQMFLGQEL